MIGSGLSKGTMQYAGFGPQHAWTLTTRKNVLHDVWKVFLEKLPHLQQSTFYFGRDHFLIKIFNPWSRLDPRDAKPAQRFLAGKSIAGSRLAQIISSIDTIAGTLHDRNVRIFNNMLMLEIMSQEYYDELKSGNEEKTPGLYADQHGYCRIPHQKRTCKIYSNDRCIFVRCNISHTIGARTKQYYCGKFNYTFSSRQISLLANGKIAGTIGSCKNLRGFEIA
ncbi:MAG: hypothetical protein WC819_02970 [Parcubacteria group bacterium]|jgi:hypothetical protein